MTKNTRWTASSHCFSNGACRCWHYYWNVQKTWTKIHCPLSLPWPKPGPKACPGPVWKFCPDIRLRHECCTSSLSVACHPNHPARRRMSGRSGCRRLSSFPARHPSTCPSKRTARRTSALRDRDAFRNIPSRSRFRTSPIPTGGCEFHIRSIYYFRCWASNRSKLVSSLDWPSPFSY